MDARLTAAGPRRGHRSSATFDGMTTKTCLRLVVDTLLPRVTLGVDQSKRLFNPLMTVFSFELMFLTGSVS